MFEGGEISDLYYVAFLLLYMYIFKCREFVQVVTWDPPQSRSTVNAWLVILYVLIIWLCDIFIDFVQQVFNRKKMSSREKDECELCVHTRALPG